MGRAFAPGPSQEPKRGKRMAKDLRQPTPLLAIDHRQEEMARQYATLSTLWGEADKCQGRSGDGWWCLIPPGISKLFNQS